MLSTLQYVRCYIALYTYIDGEICFGQQILGNTIYDCSSDVCTLTTHT